MDNCVAALPGMILLFVMGFGSLVAGFLSFSKPDRVISAFAGFFLRYMKWLGISFKETEEYYREGQRHPERQRFGMVTTPIMGCGLMLFGTLCSILLIVEIVSHCF